MRNLNPGVPRSQDKPLHEERQMAFHDTRLPDPNAEAPPRTVLQDSAFAPRGELKPIPAPIDVRPCQPEGRLYE